VNYVSHTVLKQRAELAAKRDEETIIGQILVLMVVISGLVLCSWMFR